MVIPTLQVRGQYPVIDFASLLVASKGVESTLCKPETKGTTVVQVMGDILPSTGRWRANQLAYNLSSELPGGPWFMTLVCSSPDATAWVLQ